MKRFVGLIVLSLLLVACGDGTSVFEVGVGDCFDDPDTDEVASLELIDCAEPHDNEVFATANMPDGDFPGVSVIESFAFDECLAEFQPYTGEAYDTSPLAITYLGPSADSWGNGDREVLCILYALDLSKLTGSEKG